MNISFFGSDDFAAAHLKALIATQHKIDACVTQPDRPKGRGMKVVISQIKECAQTNDIPVLQPATLKDEGFVNELKKFRSDIFVVIAYGRFLPGNIRNMPTLGAINVHASLLPKYRGAAPINWAIINGEEVTGISIIKITKEMDAGDIHAQTKIAIDRKDTSITLKAKLMEAGPSLLRQTLDALADKRCVQIPQDQSQVTLAPKLTKELGVIQWAKKSNDIYNLTRGLLPWPGAYTTYQGKLLKIMEAEVFTKPIQGCEPGMVSDVSQEGIVVATGDGGILVKKVHLQDAKPMDASAFVRGHKVEVGFQFK